MKIDLNQNIKTTQLGEPDYPKLLSAINDPPKKLYYRGQLAICNQSTLAAVGSRQHSDYGRQACQQIIGPLARQGIIIVSGLALGIDGLAHQAALDNQGQTIAVLGSGVDQLTVHPASHRQLAENIIRQDGLLISEYPPGFKPTNYSFPQRNRIIAGLSLATLIIEAAKKSGALITAQCALDYNREVLAIPHPITAKTGEGANNLIQTGAGLVNKPEDIINLLHLPKPRQPIRQPPTWPTDPAEAKILKILSTAAKHIDLIIKESQLDSSVVNGKLTLLEINGLIKNIGGMVYNLNY